MRAQHRIITWLTASYFATLGLLPASLNAGDFIKSVFKGPEVTTKEPCVERLAQEIDWLERHIDQYGTVVAKQPDVWGQARLTKHRDELEKQLFEQLNQFHVYLNGTLNRADQAFLANAFSLSASLSGQQPAQPVQSQTLVGATPTGPIIQKFEAGHFLTQGNGTIALEPEIALDQLNRYINHLHELRRINEGDDTADSPGYSLNLVRIPVSVLPGRATDHGYGAEITITATPYLNEGLLPVTFRSLVVNDLVDQLGLPITKISDDRLWEKNAEDRKKLKEAEAKLCSDEQLLADQQREKQQREQQALAAASQTDPENAGQIVENAKAALRTQFYTKKSQSLTAGADAGNFDRSFIQAQANTPYPDLAHVVVLDDKIASSKKSIAILAADVAAQQSKVASLQQAIAIVVGPSTRTRNAQNPVPPSALVPVFGDEELLIVAKTFTDGYEKRDVRWNDEPKKIVHLPDVQRFLQSELQAAYQCLARPEYQELWDKLPQGFGHAYDVGGIVTAIRRGDSCQLETMRNQFISDFRSIGQRLVPTEIQCPVTTTIEPTCLEALAWAILVESALLDAHLKGDMTSVTQLRGLGADDNCPLRFYMPDPGVEERQAFQDYVRCRWPIHVFALDPVTQDQNIGDAASIRRELQLAMSLAFVGGQMSANNFTKFTRQFEAQYETIALNRTVVGFSHGDDTFGWRFYPRFQTPPTKGNIAAFHETLFGKHKDCDLLDRKIESGMRECVAVVIMPSFVPYVTFDVRSNWFRLNHHHGVLPSRDQAEPSMTDTMKLSRAVQQMHNTAACIRDANCYRGGDVQLLMQRVHQLDRELPLQTMMAQVPIENTLGGFEMFSNGVTDLAPDLYGWYGGPGVLAEPPAVAACSTTAPATINGLGGTQVQASSNVCPCNIAGTTLFLVGDHFSVHDTKVIAGDRCISDVTLLSRQIMRVTIPGDVAPNTLDGVEYIDVHVATPYGVTSHLHIPFIRKEAPAAAPAAKKEGVAWDQTILAGSLCFEMSPTNTIQSKFVFRAPPTELVLKFADDAHSLFPAAGRYVVELFADADEKPFARINPIDLTVAPNGGKAKISTTFAGNANLAGKIAEAIAKKNFDPAGPPKAITGKTYVQFDNWPFIKLDTDLTIKLEPLPTQARGGHSGVSTTSESAIGVDAQASISSGPGFVLTTVPVTPAVVDTQPVNPGFEILPTESNPSAPSQSNVSVATVAPSVASGAAGQPTPTPQQVPVFGPPVASGGTTFIAVPQLPGTTTTTTIGTPIGVPVIGQPVPVPVLVPSLPAPPAPAALPKRQPCPCKALRFAVPGEAPFEGVPGEELGSIPVQSLKRMLGWSEPVLHDAPGFLDPDLMPAGYMRPLPATN